MTIKRLVMALLLAIVAVGCSQNSPMKGATIDIDAVETLVFSNPDSALVILSEMDMSKIAGLEDLAKHSLLLTMARDKAGIIHESLNDINFAVDYYVNAPVSDSLLGVVHYYLGRVHEDIGESCEALESYFKAKSYIKDGNNSYWSGRIFYNIGYLYYHDKDYNHAFSFLDQAVKQFSLCNDSVSIAHTYNLIGSNYLLQGDHQQALAALEKASEIYTDIGQAKGLLSTVLAISSIYLEELGDVERAESVLMQAHIKYNGGEIPLNHYLILSQIKAEKGAFEEAIRLLETYLEVDSDLGLEEKSVISYLISQYYHELGNDSLAYAYLNNYIDMTDSLYEDELATVLREVEEKYRKQELQNEYNLYRKQVTYRIIIGALVLCIVISILIVEINKRKRRNLSLQSDLDGLRSQMSDFDDLKQRLFVVLNKQTEKETRLQEVLTNKMLHVQKLVDYLFLYENNSDEFKKKIRTAVVQAEKDEYFGELHEIVNEKYFGIVDHLKKLYPTLTDDELNLCCLVCFGFSNTQISILFGYTNSNSIFNKRHKVRKKMGLWPNYDSLEAYLTQLTDELKQQGSK